jgi:hypothetical protein
MNMVKMKDEDRYQLEEIQEDDIGKRDDVKKLQIGFLDY